MKTKLGISVGLCGAAIYFAGFFGGYTAIILLAGYVLLFEQNEWLRRTAVKAVALLMSFSVLFALIGFIPDILGCIDSLVSTFGGDFTYYHISSFISTIDNVLDVIRKALFLLLGVKANGQGTIPIPFVDRLVEKYF